MRYRLTVLMMILLFPVMNLLAAPVPDPSAILDIGPPPKGETAEEYRKRIIGAQSSDSMWCNVLSDPAVKKLPSIASKKDPCPWLEKNLRVKQEDGTRRLRFTFCAGTRDEQVTIINAVLRVNIYKHGRALKSQEEGLRSHEKSIVDLEERINSSQNPQEVASYQDGIKELRSIAIPERRAAIARLKQIAVIKWAR